MRKPIKIIVNGKPKDWVVDTISFRHVIMLAYSFAPGTVYTVTYAHAFNDTGGSLTDNEEVRIKDGTIFNVLNTMQS